MRRTWAAAALATAGGISAFVLEALNGPVDHDATFGSNTYAEIANWSAMMVAALALGVLIRRNQTQNRIGAVFLYGGGAGLVALAFDGLAGYLLNTTRSSIALGIASRYVSFLSFVACWFVLGVLLPAWFPNGRLLSRRWRWIEWAGATGAVMWSTTMFLPNAFADGGLLGEVRGVHNPLGLDAAQGIVTVLSDNGVLLLFLGTFGSVVSMVVRAIRSRGEARQQIKVVAYTVAVVTVLLLVTANTAEIFRSSALTRVIWEVISVLTVLALPASLGVAVLRYRLYDIDRIINRTIVYVVLSGLLAATYAAVVVVLGVVTRPLASGSDLAVAGATLVIASLFVPMRRGVQRFIDRRFYRTRYDATRALAEFAARLRMETDLRTLRDEIEGVARQTMHPSHVNLWLNPRPAGRQLLR